MIVLLFAACIVLGFLYVVGLLVKAAAKPLLRRRNTVVGAAKVGAWTRAAWRGRAVLMTGGARLTLAFAAFVVVVAWRIRPDDHVPIIALGFIGTVSGLMAWDWVRTNGRDWKEVRDELQLIEAFTAAVQVINPAAKPGKVQLGAGRTVIPVSHVGTVDFEGVGQVLHAPHTSFEPGAEMGRGSIIVHDRAPEPEPEVWDAIRARGTLILPPPDIRGTANPRLGEDRYGNVHTLPPVVDPEHGRNILLSGATGSGKSAMMTTLQCELAWQRYVAWVGMDPHRIELKRFAPRMAHYAPGVEESVATLEWLLRVMRWRIELLDEHDLSEWPMDGSIGPGILWWLDEFSSIPLKTIQTTVRPLLQEQRKTGMGCVLAMQRPSKEAGMILEVRDNCRTRISGGLESLEAGRMMFELEANDPLNPKKIPEDLNGAYVLRLNRNLMTGRAYLPSHGGTSKRDIDTYGREVAAATAHLNVPI